MSITDTPMPFGKYKGIPVYSLETEYLFWLLSQQRWFKANYYALHAAVMKVALRRLQDEAPPPRLAQVEGQPRFKVVSAAEFMAEGE